MSERNYDSLISPEMIEALKSNDINSIVYLVNKERSNFAYDLLSSNADPEAINAALNNITGDALKLFKAQLDKEEVSNDQLARETMLEFMRNAEKNPETNFNNIISPAPHKQIETVELKSDADDYQDYNLIQGSDTGATWEDYQAEMESKKEE